MELVRRHHLEPQTGIAVDVNRGQFLRVIDPSGQQVADLLAFSRSDTAEWLSSGRTIDYNNTIYLTAGHLLYSNRSNPMLTITEDRVGRHDFLLTPCSPDTFRILYHHTGPHPSCFDNLTRSLAPYGIGPDSLPTTFKIFMDVAIDPSSGELRIGPPRSRAGDFIELRAEMDLILGVTACSAEKSNNHSFKPIDLEIYG
ncbi:urea carboxylase-associated family protein [soil metagenome]